MCRHHCLPSVVDQWLALPSDLQASSFCQNTNKISYNIESSHYIWIHIFLRHQNSEVDRINKDHDKNVCAEVIILNVLWTVIIGKNLSKIIELKSKL